MKVDRQQLADVCKQFGPQIQGLPKDIDGAALLWAIAGNESSFGANCAPRHEIEYCPLIQWRKHLSPEADIEYIQRPGLYARDPGQPELYRQFGCLACCSFTPWQIMAGHAREYTPLQLMDDLQIAATAVCYFLNQKMSVLHPSDLSHFAALWNGSPSFEYVAELKKNYAAGFSQ